MNIADTILRLSCPACNRSGCVECRGTGWVLVDPYREGGGEQGSEPEFGPSPFWAVLPFQFAEEFEGQGLS